MLRLIALFFFLVSQSANLAAQDPRLSARLDSVTRAQVESLVSRAQDHGIPTEPLVQKALEGSSKGAPGPRIVTAVESTFADLRRARQALGQSAASDEIVAEIRRVSPRGGVAVPLAVFTDLVAGGMAVDAAWRSVSELAERGGDDQAF